MTTWAAEDLLRIAATDTVGISSRRPDGSLRRYVTIWAVRLDDEVYVRSAYGPDNPWFVRARASGTGRIKVAGREQDVRFEDVGAELDEPLHAAYHAKYDRHPPRTVATVVSAEAARSTLRLVPT